MNWERSLPSDNQDTEQSRDEVAFDRRKQKKISLENKINTLIPIIQKTRDRIYCNSVTVKVSFAIVQGYSYSKKDKREYL